jgi:signal transduction histidine kinase
MSLKSKWTALHSRCLVLLDSIPVTIKVTAYYTIFLTILLGILMIGAVRMAHVFEGREASKKLLKVVEKAARNEKEFDIYQKNTYLSVLNEKGEVVYGVLPEGFPSERPHFGEGSVPLEVNGNRYHFADIPMRPPREMQIGMEKKDDAEGSHEDKANQGPFLPGSKYGRRLWVRGVMSDESVQERIQTLVLACFLILPFFVLLVSLGGYRIIRRSFAPIASMSNAARAIGETGDLSKRLPVSEGSDEIHQMGHTLNHMLDQIDELMQREKRFTSDVSHELRTPIAVIMAESEYGKDYTENVEEAKKEFSRVFEQSRNMNRMINQLLELSRLGNKQTVPLREMNLSGFVKGMLEDYQKIPESQELEWTVRIEDGITVKSDEALFGRVFVNYLDNAMKFTRSRVDVELFRRNGHVILSVGDDGQGMDPATLKKIWDRLFQADSSRSRKKNAGLGLGLSFVAAAAKLLKVKAYAKSKQGVGSTFYLEW